MPFVLTVDQIDSRRRGDLVESTLVRLDRFPTRLAFTRTVGDEFQALLDDAMSVVGVTLVLMREGQWHIGIGVGSVELPLPGDVRSARGPAFIAARAAVEQAKSKASHVRAMAPPPAEKEAGDVDVVFRLLGSLWERRTEEGWQAVDLVASGATQTAAAERLGVSQQAISQRLHAAHWSLEQDTVPVLARLLSRADSVAGGP